MAGKWRQLAPHFVVMLVIYAIAVIAVGEAFGIRSFWGSLVIALVIAILYPPFIRSFGLEPEVWKREG